LIKDQLFQLDVVPSVLNHCATSTFAYGVISNIVE
jgi:hypothetical protein